MVTKSYGRAAAWTAAVILGVVAGFQFYWSLGGTWGLHEASGGAAPPMSASEQIGAAIIGLIALAAAGVLLVRVGYWREHVPFAVARIGAWVIAIAALGGALGYFGAHTDFERFVFGGGRPDRRAAGLRGCALRAACVAQERGSADAEWSAGSSNPSSLAQTCRLKRPPRDYTAAGAHRHGYCSPA